MTYVSLIAAEEAAPAFIRELGSLGCIQFTDLNPELTPFQRRYVSYIKRCDEIERKIRYLNGEVKKLNIPVQEAGTVDSFLENCSGSDQASGVHFLETLEGKLDVYECQLVELNKYGTKLAEEYLHKVEYHHLLKKAIKFVAAHSKQGKTNNSQKPKRVIEEETGLVMSPFNDGTTASNYQADDGREMAFSNLGGTISIADRDRFYRMVYRATRGNCMIRFSSLSDKAKDSRGERIDKTCFVIFYKSLAIETKLKRICDAFSANRYDLSAINRDGAMKLISEQNQREMKETKRILDANTDARLKICVEVAQHLENWLWSVRREKSVYHTLNLFKNDVAGNLIRGRGWILNESLPQAKTILKRAHGSKNPASSALLEPVKDKWPTPPTHFKTNKYTWAFQEFVNTYGVPRYREANPALFTAATFPFFFGVMYGDIGHGSILAMGGLYLILTESKANARGMDEMLSGIYSARYMLFAMGLMAVYAGFIYNDYFSIGLDILGSRFVYDDETEGAKATRIGAYGDPAMVYPFGVDPAWKISGNELLFYNSMKMKMSVILGIFHMTFGIILRGMNCFYFKSWVDLVCEFLPMILFDLALFGYMVIMIFVKWSINWDNRMALGTCSYNAQGVIGACDLATSSTGYCFNAAGSQCNALTPLSDVCTLGYGGTGGGCQPPNLITTLINIALKPGSVDEPMYAGQAGVQTFLLLIAFICVPWLLFVKPFYLRYKHNQELTQNPPAAENRLLAEEDGHGGHGGGHGGGDHGHGDGEFNFGEIFIHQAIETIEFVLGMVSNTASYLRLWALSLAHTELATVFWEKAMVGALNTGNPVLIFMGFAVFASVTFGVLLAMDVLECFLHALRLHWVEFQNKFFKADGYRFQPFSFKLILEKANLE
jgi:V-type H+-transporting ATPase subunit a